MPHRVGAIIIDTNYQSSTLPPNDPSLLPTVKNVTFSNLSGPMNTAGMGMCPDGGLCPTITLTGLPKSQLQNITLKNINLSGTDSSCINGMNAVTLINVNVPGLVPTDAGTWMCP